MVRGLRPVEERKHRKQHSLDVPAPVPAALNDGAPILLAGPIGEPLSLRRKQVSAMIQ